MLPSENVTIALRWPVSPLALSVVKPLMARFDAETVICDGPVGPALVAPHALGEITAARRTIPRSTAFTCGTQCKEHADSEATIEGARGTLHGAPSSHYPRHAAHRGHMKRIGGTPERRGLWPVVLTLCAIAIIVSIRRLTALAHPAAAGHSPTAGLDALFFAKEALTRRHVI